MEDRKVCRLRGATWGARVGVVLGEVEGLELGIPEGCAECATTKANVPDTAAAAPEGLVYIAIAPKPLFCSRSETALLTAATAEALEIALIVELKTAVSATAEFWDVVASGCRGIDNKKVTAMTPS